VEGDYVNWYVRLYFGEKKERKREEKERKNPEKKQFSGIEMGKTSML